MYGCMYGFLVCIECNASFNVLVCECVCNRGTCCTMQMEPYVRSMFHVGTRFNKNITFVFCFFFLIKKKKTNKKEKERRK